MSASRFDILFDGSLLPDTDPVQARARLGAAFKLDAVAIERLFSGKTVVIKRDADTATAERYQQVFAEVGAVVRLRPVGGEETEQPAAPAAERPATASTRSPADEGPRPTSTDLSPDTTGPAIPQFSTSAEFDQLEEPPPVKAPALDLSYLSLVSGQDWDLSDCSPPPSATPIPDISHLRLTDLEPPDAGEDDLTQRKPES